MRGGDTLTFSVFDVDLTTVGGVVSVGESVLLWVWVAGPSRVNVTNKFMESVEFSRVSLTHTNHERQTAVVGS